ncbi:MAG TPA: hypothetical protein VI790_05145 [Candidatus Nanoarchaeia archaeon]|nr:hypothetical protein [Candidatus Nanoarchaeia archaeon]
MSNVRRGLILGIIAGVIDVIPMAFQGLALNACLSAFSMWVVIGYLMSVPSIKLKGALKGLLVSFLVLLPNLFIIGLDSLLPITIMTVILGSALGYFIEK